MNNGGLDFIFSFDCGWYNMPLYQQMVGSKQKTVVSLRIKPPYINGIENPTSCRSWGFRVSTMDT